MAKTKRRSDLCDAAGCLWAGAVNKEDIALHAFTQHGAPEPQGRPCRKCGQVSKRTSQRSKHNCTASPPKEKLSCRYGCGAKLGREDNLNRHYKSCKRRNAAEQNVRPATSCSLSITNTSQTQPVLVPATAVPPPPPTGQLSLPVFDPAAMTVPTPAAAAVEQVEAGSSTYQPAGMFDHADVPVYNMDHTYELEDSVFQEWRAKLSDPATFEQYQSRVNMNANDTIDPSLLTHLPPSSSSLGSYMAHAVPTQDMVPAWPADKATMTSLPQMPQEQEILYDQSNTYIAGPPFPGMLPVNNTSIATPSFDGSQLVDPNLFDSQQGQDEIFDEYINMEYALSN